MHLINRKPYQLLQTISQLPDLPPKIFRRSIVPKVALATDSGFTLQKTYNNFFEISQTAVMSTGSRRSSSVSSASSGNSTSSPKSNKGSGNGIKKKFACSHDGCGKSFSRSEHLHRHALNHKDGDNTCLRCSAHFRRRDLLG